MYINTFKYTPKDVSCQLCTEYVKKLGCTALRCPWLAERIEAGVVGYREAVMETFPRDRRLSSRLNLLIKHYPGSLWSNEQHERRMQYQCAVQGYLFDFYTLFSCNPAVFFETSGFFQITTPRVLFLPSQQPPSQISETARTAGRCDRRGMRTTPRLCPASPLAASPSAESRLQASFFCVCHFRNAPARRCNVRSSGFRWVRARLCCESRTNR